MTKAAAANAIPDAALSDRGLSISTIRAAERDRIVALMAYRASGLNLVVNAIVL